MFGRPEWFTKRIAGWGIAPKTWQGWVYMLVFTAIFIAIGASSLTEGVKQLMMGFLGALLLVDVVAVSTQLGKHHDERFRLHQLIIERNCSFAAVFSVGALIGVRIYGNQALPAADSLAFDPLLLGVLGIMVLTKLISTIYLRYRM